MVMRFNRSIENIELPVGFSGSRQMPTRAFNQRFAAGTADLSHPTLGHPSTPIGGAFLAALPLVRAVQVQTDATDNIVINVGRPSGGATVTSYGTTGAIAASTKSPSTTQAFPVARIASRVDWPMMDQNVTADDSTDNRAAMNMRLCAVGVLGEVSRQLVQGSGAGGELKGLDAIITDLALLSHHGT